MLSEAERLKIEIADIERQITANDTAIEDAERRQDGRRRQGDTLYRRLLLAQASLERESARLVKPRGKCVVEVAHDGVKWDV
jgi:hypothetical protein